MKTSHLNFLFILLLILTSCSNNATHDKPAVSFISLPESLAAIPDTSFVSLNEWISDAQIIGLTEGTHGMNEPLDFRNSFIRYLVKNKQIRVLAFESGLPESKIIDDFIQGKTKRLDFALKKGFSYDFGEIKQNKALLIWLRKINLERAEKDRVHFYGFDMAGSAPNSALREPGLSLKISLDYLQKSDQEAHLHWNAKFSPFLTYLRVDNSSTHPSPSYTNLSNEQRKTLLNTIDLFIQFLEKKEQTYTARYGKENCEWGLQAARCAKQNILFLEETYRTNSDQHIREKFMFDNLKWILNREKNQRILLFGHLSHLSKDISGSDKSGKETIPRKMLGEYIGSFYGSKYRVIGNVYATLNYSDGKESVKTGSLPELIRRKYKTSHCLIRTNTNDPIFHKSKIVGVPSPTKGDIRMLPVKAMDVILYTEQQHDCFNTSE